MTEAGVCLSVAIPAFNEAGRIGRTLERLLGYLETREYRSEIVVVDDGSTDSTARIVGQSFPAVRCIQYGVNRGKGYASARGAEACQGRYILIYDADGSTPCEEIEKLFAAFEAGADMVIGSRALPASEVEVPQPRHRRVMGRGYNALLRMLGLTEFRDTQCGFKALTREARDIVIPRLTVNGFGADCEMLVIARRHGLKVVEIPVRWVNSEDTRVQPLRHSFAMFGEALKIRSQVAADQYR